ncbi:MAG: hypothetical protein ACE5G1_08445 [bacterium]
MSSYLAFVASVLIGGLLLWRVLTFQTDLKEHSYKQNDTFRVQDAAMGVVEVLNDDFKRIGLGVLPPVFLTLDDDTLEYITDVDDDSNPDIVRYFLTGTDILASTPNPQDRILFRQVNAGAKLALASGVTDFEIKYFDQTGMETNTPADIKTMLVTLQMESTTPHDGEYVKFLWREKITPPNLLF